MSDPVDMKRFMDQIFGTPKREYPQGRIAADDEGVLAMAMAVDARHGVIRIEFGKPVEWMAIDKVRAVEFAEKLLSMAKQLP